MPNNPSHTAEWEALKKHKNTLQDIHIKDLFSEDNERFEHFNLELDGVLFDYSKNLITAETITLLADLARAQSVEEWRDKMFAADTINDSEKRAALHTALRGSCDTDIEVEGENINEFVNETLQKVKGVTEEIRNQKKIKHVVNIGIGGSDIGPLLVCESLDPFCDGPKVHFVSNVDGAHLSQTLEGLETENTVVIVASKTFTTLETMTNAESAKHWLGKYATTNMIAVTSNNVAAQSFGILPENILPMRDWIGGRYSLWSAIGLPIAIAAGFENFEKLLAGAYAADMHFKAAPLEKNIPVIMALLFIWYRNFWNTNAYAILPYAQNLQRLPAYIQQLEMESNGKSVDRNGEAIDYKTAPVVFGETGTNAQHAFFQMLHQGSDTVPCDFIAAIEGTSPLEGHKEKLLANVIGQSKALMEGQDNENKHRYFPGNKPSSTILLPRLDAYYTGMLLALYEHKTFVEGSIWNINSFDQWGVELGKTCSKTMLTAIESHEVDGDSSTKSLIKHVKQNL